MVKAKKARPRVGRPPVADADRREAHVHVLMTRAEHAELKRAAADASMSASSWMRIVALERARQLAARKRAKVRQEEHGSGST